MSTIFICHFEPFDVAQGRLESRSLGHYVWNRLRTVSDPSAPLHSAQGDTVSANGVDVK